MDRTVGIVGLGIMGGAIARNLVDRGWRAIGLIPRIVVELSTLAIADKLRFESTLKNAGHIALDCPLSGTGAQARDQPFQASKKNTRSMARL